LLGEVAVVVVAVGVAVVGVVVVGVAVVGVAVGVAAGKLIQNFVDIKIKSLFSFLGVDIMVVSLFYKNLFF
jgi:hypothetical protein